MDWQTLLNIGVSIAIPVLGWFLNSQRAKQKDVEDKASLLKTELTEFRIEVAKDYVTTHDLADIKNSLIRIETKLDGKADR